MIFAWTQNGTLCTTDNLQNVPHEYRDRVVEFPHLSWPQDADRLTVSDGAIRERSAEEVRQGQIQAVLQRVRAERNRRLAETDWIVIRASERGEPVPAAWAAYRQALRDLPQLLTDEQILSGQIPWPEPPAS